MTSPLRRSRTAPSRIGSPGTPAKDRVAINCGVWRYHPTKKVFEVVANGTTTPWGPPALALPAGARSQLEDAGVAVEYSGPCTLENDSLFSYRRDRNTGRFAGVVWCHD